ncbi:glycoside hydrolase family 32 protein [Celerinatantimonas sp. YJH-8]|uniref:glycoside hydrolase family 32 protein n=1 Tax=Celerinatantimonas sp. YJH-8 TaxID=3228714 RepID=UPI0038C701B5
MMQDVPNQSHPSDFPASMWTPVYHIAPSFGLLNDPNGFCFYRGQYWLFFQWNPSGCTHKNKHWGLLTSPDLCQWQQQMFRLAPEHWYDKDGCYSGTALVEGDNLSLFYTGNVRDGEQRESYQCQVSWQSDDQLLHYGPLWHQQLAGFTGHVRDPKVFDWNGQRYMWLAAQSETLQGGVCVLRQQGNSWSRVGHFSRPIDWADHQLGYMWECPDRLVIGEQTILVCCVQGIHVPWPYYQNQNLSGYFAVTVAADTGAIEFKSDYQLLDYGFDFYAPQTCVDPDGQTILIGWMGLPDTPLPPTAIHHGWSQQLTIPRICQWQNGQLYQRPIPSLLAQAKNEQCYQCETQPQFACPASSVLSWQGTAEKGALTFGEGEPQWEMSWDEQGLITINRHQLAGPGSESIRCYQSFRKTIHSWQLFFDHSSFELFVNGGEAVLSGRMYPDSHWPVGNIQSTGQLTVQSLGQFVQMLNKEDFGE